MPLIDTFSTAIFSSLLRLFSFAAAACCRHAADAAYADAAFAPCRFAITFAFTPRHLFRHAAMPFAYAMPR
jgi:hypothetical protein